MSHRPAKATPRTSCITHRPGIFYTKIYADYVHISGSTPGAFLLYFFEWATTVGHGDEEGWISVSLADLAERSNGIASKTTCHRALADLIDKLLIEKRFTVEGDSQLYRLNTRRLQMECDCFASAVFQNGTPADEPFQNGTPTVPERNADADPVLIEGFNNIQNDSDNPPTPLELDRPIDKWAAEQARNHGLKLKINTAKKRQALTEADSPELRVQIEEVFEQIGPTGEDATAVILGLVGFSNHRRSSGMARQSLGASHARSYAPTLNQPKVDTALQETPLAQEIRDCRSAADLQPRLGDFLNMPAWKVAALDAMRLQDKSGFRTRLTETFTNLADDYRQGVTTDAIVETFFDLEQRHTRTRRNSKTAGIAEYIESLGSREA